MSDLEPFGRAVIRAFRLVPWRRYPGWWIYVLVCGVLWTLPVLGILHVESSAVVAFAAFFIAGLSSLRAFGRGQAFRRQLRDQELGLLIPWAMLTLSLLWRPNCGYLQGLLFFALFPVVTVVLAVALAYALSARPWRFRGVLFGLIGVAVAALTPLFDLGLHPQFYVYNHVFGGVLGPIYDEELVLRRGLFAFRGLTLLWAALCYLVGRHLRVRRAAAAGKASVRPASSRRRGRSLAAITGVVGLIGACYLFAAPLGINTYDWYIQQALGAVHRTAHFDIYYDPASLSPEEVAIVAEDHEYRYAWLAERLDLVVEERIESYLYPDPETKARLTGARLTNVAPVWLRTPQLHVLLPYYGEVFPHELAHVFSRSFGLPVLHASLAVGLVEGLAVALEPPDGLPGPHDQVAVSLWMRAAEGETARDLAADLAARLSPLGFWTGRGAVSYTTMGSFVRYLLDAYGAGPLKAVYAWANFEDVYGKPAAALALEWQQYLLAQPVVPRATAALVARRFSIPSLFEKPCPHYVPRYRRAYRAGVAAFAAGELEAAQALLSRSLAAQLAYVPALDAWARLRLAQGAPAAVAARLDTLRDLPEVSTLNVRLGDAYVLLGRPEAARRHYAQALDRLPLYEHEEAARLVMRTALAEAPEVIRILVSAAPAATQADALAALAARMPAAAGYRALRLAEAGQYARAAALLGAAPLVHDPDAPPRGARAARTAAAALVGPLLLPERRPRCGTGLRRPGGTALSGGRRPARSCTLGRFC